MAEKTITVVLRWRYPEAFARALRKHYGQSGKATRDDVRQWLETLVEAGADDVQFGATGAVGEEVTHEGTDDPRPTCSTLDHVYPFTGERVAAGTPCACGRHRWGITTIKGRLDHA